METMPAFASFPPTATVNLLDIPRNDVFFNNRVRRLQGDDALANYYIDGSWIPAGKWEPVPSPVYAALTRSQAFSIPYTIAKCRISDADLSELQQKLQGRRYGRGFLSPGDPLVESLRQAVESFATSSVPTVAHVPQAASPGSWTLTCDNEQPRFRIGLHIDSWEDNELDIRETAMNRVSVNLGPGERYFLFGPLTLRGMHEFLLKQNSKILNVNSIRDQFYQLHTAWPTFAVRIRVGEAYLAPTENIVHDGSTFASTADATHIPIRGLWTPLAANGRE